MIAPCVVHVPVHRLPAHVAVIRHGRRLTAPAGGQGPQLVLQRGDEIRVARPARFVISDRDDRVRIDHGQVRLSCRRQLLVSGARPPPVTVLAFVLRSGRIEVRARSRTRRPVVISRELLAQATSPGTSFVVDRNPAAGRARAWTRDRTLLVARASDLALRIDAQVGYTAIADARGLRLDVWPFSLTRAQRPARLTVRFWNDGRSCSVGCRASGAIPGWPLRPFHQQHALRAGLNELRPANFHIGIDIEAQNAQAVYPIQSGFVTVFKPGTADEHVQVGQFQYWHINHAVSNGQYAVAYRTVLGRVKYDFRHVHLSELGPAGQDLNPLRPGRTLEPYTDTEAPIIGIPRVFRDGSVSVGAFDPQSFVAKGAYETPVLAPAALAWQLFTARGRPVTALAWALRGSQNYPPALRSVIFASGARNPGYNCFAYRHVCVPNWVYRLAGGLTAPLPVDIVAPGRYRLTVYAWDWAGNTSALDVWIRLPLRSAMRAPRAPAVAAFDYG